MSLVEAVLLVTQGRKGSRCAVQQHPRPGVDECVDGFVGAVEEFCHGRTNAATLAFESKHAALAHARRPDAVTRQWSFCLTDNRGDRHYGHTIVFDGEVRAHADGSGRFVLCSMSLCMLSRSAHFAFFAKLNRAVLDAARREARVQGAPLALDQFARELTRATPLPPRDTTLTLRVAGLAPSTLTLRSGMVHPIDSCAPSSPDACGASLTDLFTRISVEDVLTIIAHLVTDGKVLLHCADRGALTPVATALQALCFPLVPQSTFVPFVPTKLGRTLLQAPTPYLFGIESSSASPQTRCGDLPAAVLTTIDRLTGSDPHFALLVVDLNPRPPSFRRVVLRTMAADAAAAAAAATNGEGTAAPAKSQRKRRGSQQHPPGSADFAQPARVLKGMLHRELLGCLKAAVTWGPDGKLELLRHAPGALQSQQACAAVQEAMLQFWACALCPAGGGEEDEEEEASSSMIATTGTPSWLEASITVCHWRHRYGLWCDLAEAEVEERAMAAASKAAAECARAAAVFSSAATHSASEAALASSRSMQQHTYAVVRTRLGMETYFRSRATAVPFASAPVKSASNVWQHLPQGMSATERLHHRYFHHVAMACMQSIERAAAAVAKGSAASASASASTSAAPMSPRHVVPPFVQFGSGAGLLEARLCAAIATPALAFGRDGKRREKTIALSGFSSSSSSAALGKAASRGAHASSAQTVLRFVSTRAVGIAAAESSAADAEMFSDDASDTDEDDTETGSDWEEEAESMRITAAATSLRISDGLNSSGLSAEDCFVEKRLTRWLTKTEREVNGVDDAKTARRCSRRLSSRRQSTTISRSLEAALSRKRGNLSVSSRRMNPRYLSWMASSVSEDDSQLSVASVGALRNAKRRVDHAKREFNAFKRDVERTLKGDMCKLLVEAEGLVAKHRSVVVDKRQRRAIERELKTGNVRVLCRVRGGRLLKSESRMRAESDEHQLVQARTVRTIRVAKAGEWEEFELDRVLNQDTTQSEVFAQIVPVVRRAIGGFNACVMAYGSTGSGKSYTMLGSGAGKHKGIAPRMVDMLFEELDGEASTSSFEVTISVIEIYDEKMRDLLLDVDVAGKASSSSGVVVGSKPSRSRAGSNGALKLQAAAASGGLKSFDVVGAKEVTVRDSTHAAALIEYAALQRVTRDNGVNDTSSRSHLVIVFRCAVEKESVEGAEERAVKVKSSVRFKMMLVDLAGSERMGTTKTSGATAAVKATDRECRQINKSLSALGDVVHALSKKKTKGDLLRRHVPYRNSTLTMLLSDCLGGDSCSVAIVTVSPSAGRVDDTRRSLAFGAMLRQVKNSSTQHRDVTVSSKAEVRAKLLAERAKMELKKAQKELRAAKRKEKRANDDVRKLSTAKKDEQEKWRSIQKDNEALKEINADLSMKLQKARDQAEEEKEAAARASSETKAVHLAEVAQRKTALRKERAVSKKREEKLLQKVKSLRARLKKSEAKCAAATAATRAQPPMRAAPKPAAQTPSRVAASSRSRSVRKAAQASGERHSPQRRKKKAKKQKKSRTSASSTVTAVTNNENGGGGGRGTAQGGDLASANAPAPPRFLQPTVGSARKQRVQHPTASARKRARGRVAAANRPTKSFIDRLGIFG